jgi:hypothetical protein
MRLMIVLLSWLRNLMTEAFLKSVDEFVARSGVDVVQFKKGERKDAVTQKYLARLRGTEGVL